MTGATNEPMQGSLSIGQVVDGKYEIVRLIGEGAWGDVFEGLNTRIKRRVALKVLKAEYAEQREMVTRFEREAMTATQIESPFVVQVYDAGVLADGRPYLVMEYLTGEDLATRLARSGGTIGEIEAATYCLHSARGLAVAHAAGVLHRDIKPGNIFLAKSKSGEEVAKIVDFGISKLVAPGGQTNTSKTQTGFVLGSPVYMSPEQARGNKGSDQRSDIFSLGVVLFECLVGRPPFDADTFNELMFKIALEQAPEVRTLRPDVDEALSNIVAKALARDPWNRYASAEELQVVLKEWLDARGAPVGEWRTASGPRPAEIGLASTGPKAAELPPTLIAQKRNDAVDTKTDGGASSLASSATGAAEAKPKRSMAVVALAAGVLAIGGLGVFVVKGRSGTAPANTIAATAEPTIAVPATGTVAVAQVPSGLPSVSATVPVVSATASGAAPAASVTGKALEPTSTGGRKHLVHATSSATSPSTTTTPAATASVGGRTIHTNL